MDIKTEIETEETAQVVDGQEVAAAAGEENAAGEGEVAAPGSTEEVVDEVEVSIGEPDPQAEEERKAPQWVKDLRRQNRELAREKKELEARLAKTTAPNPVTIGKKPTLEDFDFDAEKFEAALTAYFEQKRKADQQEDERKNAEKAQAQAWQGKLDNYDKRKAEIKVPDFAEAEAETQNTLNQTQLAIIVQGAENPALVVYALGKNPTKVKKLAQITDPVAYAFAVAKLEAQLKVAPRKPIPSPEGTVTGSTKPAAAVDSALERLREEAHRTGDYSKVLAYKQQKRKP